MDPVASEEGDHPVVERRIICLAESDADERLLSGSLSAAHPAFPLDIVHTISGLRDGFEASRHRWVIVSTSAPEPTAFDALASVRAKDGLVPVILVAESLPEAMRERCVAVGFADCVLRRHLDRLPLAIELTARSRAWQDDRLAIEAQLALERTLLGALLDSSPDQIYFKDRQSRFIRVSATQARRFGLSDPTQVIGKTDFDFFAESHASEAFADEQHILSTGEPILGKEERETTVGRPDSWVLTDKMPLLDERGQMVGTFGVSRDITSAKQADEQLRFLATHDPLTGLPNRFLLNDRLRMGIAGSHRSGMPLAIMLIDIDNFKTVNDSLGHDVGDELLKSFAERTLKCLRANDTLARMGGDEFVAVLSELKTKADPSFVAKRILSSLEVPFHIGDRDLFVSASIGISVYPDDCDNAETLLSNADVAMYNIKSSTKRGFHFFLQNRHESAVEEIESDAALSSALEGGQFELYYQPIVDLGANAISMAEVLLRWNHPRRGLLTASEFIPAAERSGFIIPMSEWVLRSACAQKEAWRTAGKLDVPLAVNISAKHFQIEGFIQLTKRLLEEHSVAPSGILFEITESLALKDLEKSQETLRELSAFGVRVIIDDFGTGYSSLRWLKSIPAYAVKIDRLLVQHIAGDDSNVAILRAIVSMAHSLNIKVIASGVESQDQADLLRSIEWWGSPSLRCDGLEGHFFGRPGSREDFEKLLTAPLPTRLLGLRAPPTNLPFPGS